MATLREAMGDQAALLEQALPAGHAREAAGAAASGASGEAVPKDGQRGRQLPDSWTGGIEFQNVAFSHPGGWSLRDVSFQIPAGKTVALVGPR